MKLTANPTALSWTMPGIAQEFVSCFYEDNIYRMLRCKL